MSYRMMPHPLIIHSTIETRVEGLREYQPPSEVRVFSATTGELLRIEPPSELHEFRPLINPRRIK